MGAIKAGVPEHEVAIASTNAMIREIAKGFPFVELMDTWTWFQSGINTDGAHNPVTNRVVQSGDILSLNCFPMIFGYYTALERTLFCDYASNAHIDLWEKNCEVHRVGVEADQARRQVLRHRHGTQRDVPLVGAAEVPLVRLRPLASACSATTTAARPASSCARTFIPS